MKTGWIGFFFVFVLSFGAEAVQTSDPEIRLLNNRFRIDPTIAQVAFIIYREKSTQPVVLVQPDGKKLYEWDHPDNVSWHQEDAMDIISIDNPMPGPWQAIGKISTENKIRILSALTMKVDTFPARLYEDEIVKFTAQLMQEGKPLLLRDFLDRVELKVTFTEFIADENDLPNNLRPQEKALGLFIDNGAGLDEHPGDGIFTVELPIDVAPGKYRVRVTSGNGVFFRSLEEVVLVYPIPLMTTFTQSRKKALSHNLLLESDSASIKAGSLALHAQYTGPNGKISTYEGAATGKSYALNVPIDNFDAPGRHKWFARLYATDKQTGRPLVFSMPEQTFAVADFEAIEQANKEREAREAERKRIEDEKEAARKKESDRKTAIVTIIAGNVTLLFLAFLIWFILRTLKEKKRQKEAEEEAGLNAPPPETEKKQ